MNIIVTGHKGFVGGNIYSKLQSLGYNVVGLDVGDHLPLLAGFDWLIHCGAISSTTERNIELIMTQNYDYTVYLYTQCVEHGVNFQFSSTAALYGLLNEFKETSPLDPRTPYAWSKYMAERYLNQHIKNNSNQIITQIFRYFNVYGPGEEHKGTQASPFYQFATQARNTGVIKVFENSHQYQRDFVNIDTVVDYHIGFLSTKINGIFNIGSGVASSFLDVANIYAQQYNATIVNIPMPPILCDSYQKYTCADMTHTNKYVYIPNTARISSAFTCRPSSK